MATISIDWQGHNTVLHFPSEDLIVTINMEWMPSIWNGCHQYGMGAINIRNIGSYSVELLGFCIHKHVSIGMHGVQWVYGIVLCDVTYVSFGSLTAHSLSVT